jgi:hypothetical protein
MLVHYFGVQLQAVRKGRWKLILPIDSPPSVHVASLWFAHQPGLFERQHRVWPKAALYDLTRDPGETTDVAASHPEVVSELLKEARQMDERYQRSFRPVVSLPGPRPPARGQVRREDEDLSAWEQLVR